MIRVKAFVYGKIGWAFMLVFVCLGIGGLFKFVTQVLFWLKNGFWEPYSILDMLRDLDWGIPRTPSLLGVQRIIDDVLSWPALIAVGACAALCMVIGSILIMIGESFEWELQKEADAKERALRAEDELDTKREAAERTKRDFNFGGQIDEVTRNRR